MKERAIHQYGDPRLEARPTHVSGWENFEFTSLQNEEKKKTEAHSVELGINMFRDVLPNHLVALF